jgi:hypothetical protein
MSHDKLKAAVRKRTAETGEPYAVARHKVIKEHQSAAPGSIGSDARWFAISYNKAGIDKITAWLDTLLFRTGPGVSGVEITSDRLRVRMGDYKLDVPRSSVRSATRSQARLRGTTGVHAKRGRLLVNGSADGLVELTIDPPCYTGRTLNTLYANERVNSLILSLVDPDGFIAAVEGHGARRGS